MKHTLALIRQREGYFRNSSNCINSPKPKQSFSLLWVGNGQPDDLNLTLNLPCHWQSHLTRKMCREEIGTSNPFLTEESEWNQPCIGCLLKSHNRRQEGEGESFIAQRNRNGKARLKSCVPFRKMGSSYKTSSLDFEKASRHQWHES